MPSASGSTKTKSMRTILLAIFLVFALQAFAQSYVDPFHIRYTYALKSPSASGTPFSHLYIGPDLPLKLRNNSYFVISPIYEQWNIDSTSAKSWLPGVHGLALALSAVIPLDKDHWTLTASAIPRLNGEELNFDDCFQLGSVLLATYKKKQNLKYKFGVYANKEFFGLFIIPVAGIDWRIDERNYLFGVLPGRLTYEHRLNSHFYTGGTFRAITNSYRLNNDHYLRIDDNQLSAYLDCYLAKRFVVTGEAGYGILRKLRSGSGFNKNYQVDYQWGDGVFVKLALSYRVRL